MKHSRQGVAWLIWLAVVIGGFAVLETRALLSVLPGDTLSEWVWLLLDSTAFRVPFALLWFGGIVWLTMHFWRNHWRRM